METNNGLIFTTEMLAQRYGTSPRALQQNYRRHSENFKEGIHYFLAEGDSLKQILPMLESFNLKPANFDDFNLKPTDFESFNLKPTNNDLDSQSTSKKSKARKLYIWTTQGAFMHLRFLNTPDAWEAYEKMTNFTQQSQTAQQLPAEALSKIEERMTAIESRCTAFLGIANTFADQNTELKDKLIAPTLDFMERDSIEFIIGDLNELVQLKKFSKENEATIIKYLKRIEALLIRTEEVDNRIAKENIAHAGLHEEVKAITVDLTGLKTLTNQIAQLIQPIGVKRLPSPAPTMI